ncbi:hypothetical protein HD806DRAFT_515502 [Xylariaceae sp. AK1471]|nr:hypothetical protein HD806DRAFT_515502 [Xylariaceae sp. AK1471]
MFFRCILVCEVSWATTGSLYSAALEKPAYRLMFKYPIGCPFATIVESHGSSADMLRSRVGSGQEDVTLASHFRSLRDMVICDAQ